MFADGDTRALLPSWLRIHFLCKPSFFCFVSDESMNTFLKQNNKKSQSTCLDLFRCNFPFSLNMYCICIPHGAVGSRCTFFAREVNVRIMCCPFVYIQNEPSHQLQIALQSKSCSYLLRYFPIRWVYTSPNLCGKLAQWLLGTVLVWNSLSATIWKWKNRSKRGQSLFSWFLDKTKMLG